MEPTTSRNFMKTITKLLKLTEQKKTSVYMWRNERKSFHPLSVSWTSGRLFCSVILAQQWDKNEGIACFVGQFSLLHHGGTCRRALIFWCHSHETVQTPGLMKSKLSLERRDVMPWYLRWEGEYWVQLSLLYRIRGPIMFPRGLIHGALRGALVPSHKSTIEEDF